MDVCIGLTGGLGHYEGHLLVIAVLSGPSFVKRIGDVVEGFVGSVLSPIQRTRRKLDRERLWGAVRV